MSKKNFNLNIDKFVLFICFSYGFTGVNFIICGILEGPQSKYFIISLIMAVLMLCMIPVSLFDERKEMRGKFYAVVCGILHFVLSLFISYAYSFVLLMVIYVVEFIVTIITIRIVTSKKHK